MRLEVSKLKSGDRLLKWANHPKMSEYRREGPTSGAWQAMVLANEVQEPADVEGFRYPPVHRVDVFLWNEGGVRFESFFWTSGTLVEVFHVE